MQTNLNNTPSQGPLKAEDFDREEPAADRDTTWLCVAIIIGLTVLGALALWCAE